MLSKCIALLKVHWSSLTTRFMRLFSVDDSSHFIIVGQEFMQGKTIFLLKCMQNATIYRQSADVLYSNIDLIKIVNRQDLVNIVSTAIYEKTREDMLKLLCARCIFQLSMRS